MTMQLSILDRQARLLLSHAYIRPENLGTFLRQIDLKEQPGSCGSSFQQGCKGGNLPAPSTG
jgi:hypothetical protein